MLILQTDKASEISRLRETVKTLEKCKFELESDLNLKNCRLSALEEKVRGAEQNCHSIEAMKGASDEKVKDVEESLGELKGRYGDLAGQLEEAKKEILRGNGIIGKLETQVLN